MARRECEGFSVTEIVAIAVALISAVASICASSKSSKVSKEIGEKNIENLDQRRYIDAIGTQRIQWVNKVRDHFIALNSSVQHLHLNERIFRLRDIEIMRENFFVLESEINQITTLLLNTNEDISKNLLKQLREISALTTQIKCEENQDELDEKLYDLSLEITRSQQIIFKSEWKRIKTEAKLGRELNSNEFSKILKEVEFDIEYKDYKHSKRLLIFRKVTNLLSNDVERILL